MEAALSALLPKLLGQLSYSIYAHTCKQDLLKHLPDRLKGYRAWLPSDYRIVVIVDRDDDDCHGLKKKLEEMAHKAGLKTRSRVRGGAYQVVNRIVIEELEAFYFGDWDAVRKAYHNVPENIPAQKRYRDPDSIRGTWEAFEKVLQSARYFKGGLRKIEAARNIAQHMSPSQNRCRSFGVLRDAFEEMRH